MMHRDYTVLLFALILSVGLHIVMLQLVYANNTSITFTTPEKVTEIKVPKVEEPEIKLGIDDSKVSTLTWIGYDEYEEQIARHAEVEQASMNSEIASANSAIASIKQLTQPLAEMTAQFVRAMRGFTITIPSRALIPVKQEITEGAKKQIVVENIEEDQVESTPADRDAEATSIIHVSPEEWKEGKPLAAEGIVLKPKKPTFYPNQLVASRPSNLVADLYFDRRGKPIQVVILYGTGGESIDRTIENSLYRWRASGEQIEALVGEDTVKITIHILFR